MATESAGRLLLGFFRITSGAVDFKYEPDENVGRAAPRTRTDRRGDYYASAISAREGKTKGSATSLDGERQETRTSAGL
jgi:hypothetical protein